MVGDTKSVISNDHLGWMRCDGRELAVADYYSLWRVIGYEFGGSGDAFLLPDARARVAGYVGTQADINLSTFTMTLGADVGEYTHTLTIGEMPSHTHGSSNVTGNTNGDSNTTTNGTHSHTITDPGHAHSLPLASAALTGVGPADDVTQGSGYNTGSNFTGITINSNGAHNHQIFNTGGSNSHNNVQPTLVIGNMFIYSGKAISPITGFPYTENTQIL
jgi:microcystin-dependent protein